MDHKLFLKFEFIYCLQTDKYHYLFEGRIEGCEVFEYQTETDLLNNLET